MKKIYLAVVFIVFAGLSALAQNDNGAIKVVLADKTTNEKIPFANVVAFKDGVQVGIATTNDQGEAIIKPLAPGKYTIKGVFVGYQPAQMNDVVVGEGKTAYVNLGIAASDGSITEEVAVYGYQVPLIDPDTKSGQTVTREDFQAMSDKNINSVAATTAGVYQSDSGKDINVRGGRSASTTYFVDGVKVFGAPNLPQQSIEQLNVITGGVPANYGDLTSGAISISTRGPQSKYFGGVELISSQLTDPYGFNSLGFSFGGPIYKKRDSTRRTVLGFFVSGQGNYVKEPNPSFVPIYVVKDEKLNELKENPFLPSPSGIGYVKSSEFVTQNDMDEMKARPNNSLRRLSLNGKLDYAPTANTNLSLGGFYDYYDTHQDRNGNPQTNNLLFNSNNNYKYSERTWRTNLAITQKFGNPNVDKAKTQSQLSNSFFKFLVSYENWQLKIQDRRHEDNFFNYGYVGNFNRTFLEEEYAWNYDYVPGYNVGGQAVNSFTYHGRQELPIQFTPSDMNPDPALYTSWIMDHTKNPAVLSSMDALAGQGALRNGDAPLTVYNLYNNFGTVNAGYLKDTQEQFRVTSSFNTDFKKHALTVGMEFDQRVRSYYNPFNATALWTRMRQIANQHTGQLNDSVPILNEELSGLIPYYYFDNLYEGNKQTQFSEKLLEKLGLPKDYTGFVNTDALDPSILTMDMFSAEDLIGDNSAASLVNYAGYNHYGEKTGGKTDMTTFLESTDASGRHLFPVGSFRPIYASVYVMDKFDFKDIKFNIGLRVDRYDANQQVLKDKYALHELATVGDLSSLENLPAGFTDNIPGNIPQSAAVYVATNPAGGKTPTAIRGYRDGDKWYNSEGIEISDPNLINSADARPIPLYKDNANYEKNVTAGAFTNYVAAVNAMPRIAFSFPISDVANFFAHYDILTQRPTGNQLDPFDYYFMSASVQSPLITNSNLKPQQTIDYELGFSQILNERKNASLTITSFYREMRNMINQKIVVGAYPKNYVTFDNVDFGTVKGLSFIFDFRRSGGSSIKLNYTLQFAEGSGSNANSGANLAQSGQPNLRVLQPLDFDQRHNFTINYDFRFGSKKDYKGPTFQNKKKNKTVNVFEDVGFNLTFLLGSGTPYTRWNTAVPFTGFTAGQRSNIVGQINGSSKPWNFRSNLRIDKNIPLTWGKEEDNKKTANLNVYLQVLNLFNTMNVLGVYNFTGAPGDDGYLTSTQGVSALSRANSPAAFSDMYSIRTNNPANYSLPRQIRIGLLFEF